MQGEQISNDLAQTVETIWQEQLRSFDDGQLIPAEEFFQKHPEILANTNASIDVIFNEYELLCRLDRDPPDLQEFLSRFPEFKTELSRQFQVLDAFESFESRESATNGSPPIDSLSPNQESKRFHNRRTIGQGATATVEIAFDQKLQHNVALKRLHSHLQDSNRATQRLRREAQTVARLHHPNIIPIHEILDDDGQLVLVSRFVDGENLRDMAAGDATLDLKQIVTWIQQISEALHYSHENEVTHRDVKPSNIMVDSNGNAMLTDFGLASFSHSSGAITQTGELVGTPAFMSPEQALGDLDRVDHRTDIYSLGASLYFLISGHAPFEGTFANVVQQVVSQEPPPVQSLTPNVPADLATITGKCLSKNPLDRYATARELSEDLRRYQNGEVIRARKAGPFERIIKTVRRRPVMSAAVATILLLAAFLSGTLLQLGEIRDQRNRAQHAEQTNRELLASASVDAGRLSMQRGEFDRAIEHFQNSLAQGVENPAQVQLFLVESLMAQGKVDQAAEHLTSAEALKDFELNPLVAYWKTELAAVGRDEYETTSINEIDFSQLDSSKQHFFSGFNAADSPTALQHFEDAVAADLTHRNARRMLLLMALSLARFDDVVSGTQTARQMYPDDLDFQLIEALALACNSQRAESSAIIDELPMEAEERRQWENFCDFVFEATNSNSGDLNSEKHLDTVKRSLARFKSDFLPLVKARQWRFPPHIAQQFETFTTLDFNNLSDKDWQSLSRNLALVHPEATLLAAAGDSELKGANPLSQLEQSRDYFLAATTAPSFLQSSHDSAWMGLYATSMTLNVVHKHDLETNRQHMIDAVERIDPQWVSGYGSLRAMYIPLIRIRQWDLAKPFIDRAVETADTDRFKSEALWHLALWFKNRKDWSKVLATCQQWESELPDTFKADSPQDWSGFKRLAVLRLTELLED